ncbi:MAG: hypothetical protein KIT16_13970 [Rhodospirillaceae bacterium]|nr:hypothetical protein [Rhodospirillaceae bacterium]
MTAWSSTKNRDADNQERPLPVRYSDRKYDFLSLGEVVGGSRDGREAMFGAAATPGALQLLPDAGGGRRL